MKIRTAIFLVYVAASAVGLAVLMRFMLAEVRPRYVSSLQRNLDDTARLVAASLAGRPEAGLATLRPPRSGVRLRVYGADGKQLLDTARSSGEWEDLRLDSYVATRAVGDFVGERTIDLDAEIAATAPLRFADGRTGQVKVSRPVRSLNEVIWTERLKLAGIALVIAAVMVVAGWWIAARLTHSLERLTAYAQAVRDGRSVAPPRSRAVEIAELSQAFEEMRDALEGRQHAARYTKALAHEVKAPLTAIRGAAELLGEDMPAEQRQAFLGNIRSEVARVQRIVERLLELTSVEARKVLDGSEEIAADRLLAEAAEALQSAYAAQGVKLAIASGATAKIRGERFLLRQALTNLLQNALDFSPAGSEVAASLTVGPQGVVFAVEDRGPGVPDYALGRVFERFYSLPRPGTAKKSTGIGLALVREIAHLHGGEATLGNRRDGGARATLRVPIS